MADKKAKKPWVEKVDWHDGDEKVLKKVTSFIEKGVDVNVQDEKGRSALMWAAIKGYKEIAKELIKAGANVNLQDETGITALMFATFAKRKDMVNLLLEKGAFVNAKDLIGFTAAMYAAENDDSEIFQILVDYKADLNAENSFGGNVWASSHPGSGVRRIIRNSSREALLKKAKENQR